ncbi:MAG TPA: hypothetical protein VFM49_04790, partial [Chloroflexia bacterium]|nr:hypothetical protein [Chloroflexia bacterium]
APPAFVLSQDQTLQTKLGMVDDHTQDSMEPSQRAAARRSRFVGKDWGYCVNLTGWCHFV